MSPRRAHSLARNRPTGPEPTIRISVWIAASGILNLLLKNVIGPAPFQPSQTVPHMRSREGASDVFPAFREMRPVFEMNWNDQGIREGVRGLHGLDRRHGEMKGADLWNPRRAQVKDRNLRVESLCNFADTGIPHRIAGDVNGPARRIFQEQDEAIDRAATESFRTVPGGSGHDSRTTRPSGPRRSALCQSFSPTLLPARRCAPSVVVNTDFAFATTLGPHGRDCRSGDRGSTARSRMGPALQGLVLGREVCEVSLLRTCTRPPAGSNVGSVRKRTPSNSSKIVGPPT